MKKLLTLIMALILLLVFPGCGLIGKIVSKAESRAIMGNDDYSETEEYYSEPDYSSESSDDGYNEYDGSDTIYGQMSATEKAAFVQQAALSGTQVTFNADGSTTFVYDDGSFTTQNADGTWTYSSDEGTATTQFGGNWPENEFTKQVPKPDFGTLVSAVTEEKSFYVMFNDADMNKMRAYIEKVKASGFTIGAETTDETAFGVTVLSYAAKNAAGYKIELGSTMGINSITITKSE